MTPESEAALKQSIEAHNERVKRARQARSIARGIISQAHSGSNMALLDGYRLADVLESLLEQLESYEGCITWETSCTNCASLWDQNYSMHEAMEQIEKLARLRRPISEQHTT